MSRSNKEKKSIWLIVIVVLVILALAIGGFIIYNTLYKTKDNDEVKKPAITTEEPKEDVVPDKPEEDNVSSGEDVGDKNENGGTDSGSGTVEDVTNE
ncbi:MAG: hypothetical protein RR495_01770 [Anaerovoracaceae bacterium]